MSASHNEKGRPAKCNTCRKWVQRRLKQRVTCIKNNNNMNMNMFTEVSVCLWIHVHSNKLTCAFLAVLFQKNPFKYFVFQARIFRSSLLAHEYEVTNSELKLNSVFLLLKYIDKFISYFGFFFIVNER